MNASDFTASKCAPALRHIAPRKRLLVLTGFMGAGKTTVGKLLAASIRWPFVDVDALIESKTGQSIAALFEQHGEAWFRELEHDTIRHLAMGKPGAKTTLNSQNDSEESPVTQSCVLALGGGAIEDARTRRLLLETPDISLIHLEVSLSEAIRRCKTEAQAVRPVLANQERLAQRYATRLALYRQAPVTFVVDDLAPEQIVQNIVEALSLVSLNRSKT